MSKTNHCPPVCSHNEWDPLEEVILGRLEGSVLPDDHVSIGLNVPAMAKSMLRWFAGAAYPGPLVRAAERQRVRLASALRAEGIVVREPDRLEGRRRFSTPHWSSRGFTTACPRGTSLVVGDQIIEAPSSQRCRHLESLAYRRLFRDYHRRGARWVSAPRPELGNELYDSSYRPGYLQRYGLTEAEPVFDASDFVRCGRDLFVTRSNLTNLAGIDWVRRHLGRRYRVHRIELGYHHPRQIDTAFIPLAPGKVMIHPEWVDMAKLPPILKKWDVLRAPAADSSWGSHFQLNVLVIDGRRVLVEQRQKSLIRALKSWGMEPISMPFSFCAPGMARSDRRGAPSSA